jgi:5-methyltetrahydrofolate--homocysteine methyltransferase
VNTSDRAQRVQTLKAQLSQRVLVLDGAMGTAIQQKNLTAADFGGVDLEGCNENLVLTRPELIQSIHEDYLRAGCDIVETNTFGATPLVLDEYGLGAKAREINIKAASLARAAAARFSSPDQPRFVAGSIGPTTKAITVTGGVTFEELIQQFRVQAEALHEGGVDYFLLETCQDTRNIKAALLALEAFQSALPASERIPVAVSGTIEPTGTMLAGQSIEALLNSLEHQELLYIGLNCATGPEFMTDPIRSLAGLSRFPVSCVPNAGLPDENGHYLESPEMVAATLGRFIENGWINVIGGCCGTHSGHIESLARLARGKSPRSPSHRPRSALSGVDYLEITDEMRPVIVGERTNVIGSKKFKTLICEGKFDDAAEIARSQVKNGAQIIDVCMANPDRDELEDLRTFLEIAVRKIRVPLMIDSTDEKVIEVALSYSQGKAIINSINLEDGEERFEKVVPLARRYGAALVVGTIDEDPEQGMAIRRERKLAIAERSYELLTTRYGVAPEDIYWDPLVFPCATGDPQYVGSAVETIEGIRLIKTRFPRTRSVLGISNVSFGLPAAGREVLNSVFLYHCVKAGLDLAIVNSEKLERFAQIPAEEIELAENLLFNRTDRVSDPIAAFAAHFREKKVVQKESKKQLPLLERLAGYIIEGAREGLIDDLDLALKGAPEEGRAPLKPLAIINGPLMQGMDEVGRLFNSNQLIVAEVLQSAEAMKLAVAHLEPHMEKTESSSRGKVLLATVKGDVHDIGKNLVEIILANNGFQVINLGIKVPPEQLIQSVREHQPDVVGLSGLLVKSAQQMVTTAGDLARAGIQTPILVGGAALTENFVDRQIAPAYGEGTVAYASDAMAGLDLAKQIVEPTRRQTLLEGLKKRREMKAKAALTEKPKAEWLGAERLLQERSASVTLLENLPSAPDLERHVLRNTPLETLWRFVNPLMLYGRHLGIRGSVVRELQRAAADPGVRRQLRETEPRALEVFEEVERFQHEFRKSPLLHPQAVYQFFPVSSEGNSLTLYAPDRATARATFEFPRQQKKDGLCLADYAHPRASVSGTLQDTAALFIVSVGQGVREFAESLKNRGDYLRSHILQALALETAEAYAEYLHSQLRRMWGFPDPETMTQMERFQAKYRGKRYSFGYPACPRLDDQAILFDLLKPAEIGVQLTDGFMMDPEASVSALVFHHPDASYFSVGTRGEGGAGENRQ